MGVMKDMKLTLRTPEGESTIEAHMVDLRGDFLAGTLLAEFSGQFPVDPLPFMPPPPPKAPPNGGWYTYEVPPPKSYIEFRTSNHLYSCRVASVSSTGFILKPYFAANLRAVEALGVGHE